MINNVVLMGRLTAEPELKHTQSGLAFVRFTLAVQRNAKSNNGETATDFIFCVAWRNTAEFVAKYFSKGQLVAVEGSIQTSSYQDQNGAKHYTVDVVANQVHFAESKKSSNTNNTSAPQTQSQQKEPDFQSTQNFADQQTCSFDGDLPF